MSIMEKARSLGEAILESTEYRELKEAEEAMYNNEEAKTLLNELNAKQRQIQMAQTNGKPINQKQQKEIQNIQARMQTNDKVKDFMEAQKNFNQVMQTVNQTITSVLNENNKDG